MRFFGGPGGPWLMGVSSLHRFPRVSEVGERLMISVFQSGGKLGFIYLFIFDLSSDIDSKVM